MSATPAPPPLARSERQRWLYLRFAVFAVVALLPVLVFSESQYFSTFVLAAIFASVAISLDVLLGFAGQLALGQTALFGVGAYTSAILTTKHGVSTEIGMLAGVAAAVAVALVISPLLRLRGFYFALATLAQVLIAHELFTNWISATGGASGLVGIGQFEFLGLVFVTQTHYYLFAYAVLLIVVLAAVHMRSSRFGRALVAIREDDTAAEALGISVFSMKLRVWLVAAVFAGLAGVVYAYYLRFLSPAQFGLEPAIYVLAAVVIGGTGTVYGAVLGVTVVWLLPDMFASFEEYAVLALGVAVIVLMIFAPDGLIGRTERLAAAVRRRVRPRGAARGPLAGSEPGGSGAA